MYNTDVVTEPPTSWDLVWEGGVDGAGKVSIYDSSIYIADAALRLKETQPDLGITDPYQLNEEQFNAAIDLLEQQRDAGACTGAPIATRSRRMAPATSPPGRRGSSW